MELSEFLLARIDDDEAVARAATAGSWQWTDNLEDGLWSAPADKRVISAYGEHTTGYVDIKPANALHIARHDPARVLAECDAKRRIVELEAPGPRNASGSGLKWTYTPRVLAFLALPYADHPDYDEAWRP